MVKIPRIVFAGTNSGWGKTIKAKKQQRCGAHIHFWSDTIIASEFINRCREYKVSRKGKNSE